MKNKPEGKIWVSVIMPAYNASKYIDAAINSVIAQTYPYWELIVIDDCSNDNTLQIINDYAQKDNRITVLRNNENLGVSATRNKGINHSKYNWIAFLDSDDIWVTNKLKTQINFIRQQNVEFVFTGSSFINSKSIMYKGIFNVPEIVDYKTLKKQNVINTSSVVIKKEYLERNPMIKNNDLHEDFIAWLKILKEIDYAYGISEPLTIYRISWDSKSGNKFRSVIMTYKGFRHLKMNIFQSLYFTFRHSIGAFFKYSKLRKRKA